MEIIENSVQLNILLPLCVESRCDVFYSVIKNAIDRSKLDDFVNVLKLGMNGDEFFIKSEDLSSNWNVLNSTEERIRQSKILALWAIEHFPALGKRFYGASWKPPERKNIHVIGETQVTIDDIDAIVLRKLKLRMFQLNVSPSTLKKLRHLAIDVPANFHKSNEHEYSTKIKSFEIDGEFVEESWKTLKLGKFSINVSQSLERDVDLDKVQAPTPSISHQEAITAFQSALTRKRPHLDSPSDGNGNNVASSSLTRCKRPNRGNAGNANINDVPSIELGSQSILEPMQAYRDDARKIVHNTNNDSSIDSIQVVLLEMRKDVCQLSDMVRSTVKKDNEIARLTTAVNELSHTNKNLITEHHVLKEQREKQTDLITALQKGVDATSKLLTQTESVLTQTESSLSQTQSALAQTQSALTQSESSKREMIENMVQEIADLKVQNHHASATTYTELQFAIVTNEKLRDELNLAQKEAITIQKKLEFSIDSLKASITAAEKCNSETLDQNKKLQDELNALKDCAAGKESELSHLRFKMNSLLSKTSSNTKIQSDVLIKRDADVQVKLSSNRKEVEVQTDNHSIVDVESQTVLLIECRIEVGTQTDTQSTRDIESQTSSLFECETGTDAFAEIASEENINDIDENSKDFPIQSNERGEQEDGNSKDIATQSNEKESVFVTDDPIVLQCRPILKNLLFGWMRFHSHKTAKFCPGFVYPADSDGVPRAQKVTATGYVTNKKYEFFDFSDDLPDGKKGKSEIAALKKFNKRFNFIFA